MINWKLFETARGVPGYLYELEQLVLAYLASQVPEGGQILEIGAYCGKSTATLLSGARGRIIHTVDNWSGDDPFLFAGHVTGEMVRKSFFGRVQPAIDLGRVIVHEGDYQEVCPSMAKGSYDLIFVDGPHEAEHGQPTIDIVLPLLKPGGTIAVHDFFYSIGDYPGVETIVKHLAASPDFEGGQQVRTLAIFRRKQEIV